MVMSISSAWSSSANVSDVPHKPQKLRVTLGLDLNVVGAPDVNRSSVRFALNQATDAAPTTRRQHEQWQIVS
jgi:hypothetical protein